MTNRLKGKFACIGHPSDIELFRSYIHYLKPEKRFKDGLIIKLFEWTPSYKVKNLKEIGFDGMGEAEGIIIMVPFLPEMRDIRLAEVTKKIEDAIAMAAQEGCTVAALGGFTSIVLQGQEKNLSEKYGIKLTSGNTLTAAVIVRSIEDITGKFRLDLKTSTIAVIGASGDIGSGVAGYFCDKAGKLILSARGRDKLNSVVEKYRDITLCEMEIETDNLKAIKNADIAVFVTSAYKEIVTLDDFKPRTIVCDASAPLNVKSNGNKNRPDVFLYHGGILSLPFEINPGFDAGLPSNNTFYSCQVEGMLIALDPDLPCSWGRGNISRKDIETYLNFINRLNSIDVAFTNQKISYAKEDIASYALEWKYRRQAWPD